MIGAFVRHYGAQPWNLLALLACFVLSAYAVSRLFGDSTALVRITVWFIGAAVVWDFVLGPLVAGADRALRPLHRRRVRGVAALNFVRLPLLLSGLLLLVWTPLIFRRSEAVYEAKSGLPVEVFLGRWAAVTVALVLASMAAYLVAVLRAGRPTSR